MGKNCKIFKAQIDNTSIEFTCTESPQILTFIKRDFELFESDSINNPDISIEITHDKFEYPKNYTYFDSSIISFGNTIAVRYNARFREIWVAFSTKPYLGKNIKIFMPKRFMLNDNRSRVKEKIIRMFFPNFLYRWQNALMDIIHGTLLGIIHLRLLSGDAAFLHASAISNKHGKGIVLPGWAQSGKSTIADILVKKKSWKFIAEDLCIVTKENTLVSFPKQRRVYYSQLKSTKYFEKEITIAETIQERINVFLLSVFSLIGFKPKRVLSWEEIYDKKSVEKISNLNAIVYLSRGNYDEISLDEVKDKKIAGMCSSMMLTEMQNLNGFYQLLAVYGVVSDDVNSMQTLAKNTYEQYMSAFKGKKCYMLKVPNFENIDYVENWVHHKFEKILEQ